MHSRGTTPTNYLNLGQKTFPFTPSGGGLPLYRTNRASVFQSAVKQLKNKYSQKLRQKVALVLLLFLVVATLFRYLRAAA
ncbi:hypothetical protein HOP50_01g01090 [Chloropicon primus]|uniref:Uncharacterized protein n=1 Tax=Chloropicon primus TaxID=1764295 RepID=A0A5B8ME24_9CHLO|nr:hypothetical protein A3770_01p01180 [Chloropicon primus]UPQ96818.1 hypothetical protein HOP50_01g01090 [Chloropicon primus]|mmetsp:Transcript_7039/g.20559  ORF Transcript_7039/g.20559 Transcript_7039/m.20559 type:complete len:80 (-) Transcript_7039:617-856(-)|eukprot:QDZ17600.1 hypothetical protein A3770_01p01180 [Chloropicon primus]